MFYINTNITGTHIVFNPCADFIIECRLIIIIILGLHRNILIWYYLFMSPCAKNAFRYDMTSILRTYWRTSCIRNGRIPVRSRPDILSYPAIIVVTMKISSFSRSVCFAEWLLTAVCYMKRRRCWWIVIWILFNVRNYGM